MAKNNPQGAVSRYDQIINQIQTGAANAQNDLPRRQKLLTRLEKEGEPQPRRAAMFYARLDRQISHHDILPFTSMLRGIGKVENLDLIIHSSGGDGTAADKMMDICRKYCSKKLRIVVPLYAKSAATLMALGADEIVMGETSEIGPIDAQIFIIQDGTPQQVSADHFLRAETEAKKHLASPQPEENEAARIQIASMSAAFLQQCRDLQNFSRNFAKRQLQTHMFAAEYNADRSLWDARIDSIVNNLTASSVIAHNSCNEFKIGDVCMSPAEILHSLREKW